MEKRELEDIENDFWWKENKVLAGNPVMGNQAYQYQWITIDNKDAAIDMRDMERYIWFELGENGARIRNVSV